VDRILNYYHMLLLNPDIGWNIWAQLAAAAALFVPLFVICTSAALAYTYASTALRSELTSFTRSRVSWCWGFTVGLFILLCHISFLIWAQRIAGISAALPYYIVSAVLVIYVLMLLNAVRSEVGRVQKVLG